jgi:hypothetical protein
MNIQMTAGHSFTAELSRHWADLRASFGEFRRWRPQGSLLIVMAMTIFIGGIVVGVSVGTSVTVRSLTQMDAFLRMIEAEDEASGSRVKTDRFRAQAVDRAVVTYVEDQSAGIFSQSSLTDLLTLKAFNTKWRAAERESMQRQAEMRLKLLSRPGVETFSELHKRELDNVMQDAESRYRQTAASYSILLGRQIKPADLVIDSDLRSQIAIFDQQRASLGRK